MSEHSLTILGRVPRATAMTPDDRRRAIIEAVRPLLLAQGTALSTRQLAEAAGVAEGTLYRVFESKEEILAEAALAALTAEPAVHQLGELPPGQSLTERVAAVLEILQTEIRRTRALSMALIHPPPPPDPAKPRRCKPYDRRERHQRLTEAVVGALTDHTAELAVTPQTAAQVLIALAFAASHDITDNNSFAQPRDIANLVLHGIAQGHP